MLITHSATVAHDCVTCLMLITHSATVAHDCVTCLALITHSAPVAHDCVTCLALITHSATVAQIKYIFQYLLPSLQDKTLLDIGSRTGAVLYGVSMFSCSVAMNYFMYFAPHWSQGFNTCPPPFEIFGWCFCNLPHFANSFHLTQETVPPGLLWLSPFLFCFWIPDSWLLGNMRLALYQELSDPLPFLSLNVDCSRYLVYPLPLVS